MHTHTHSMPPPPSPARLQYCAGGQRTVDDCARTEEACSQPGVTFTSEGQGRLPANSECSRLPTPHWNGGRGSLMSYCHRFGLDEMAFTFGEAPWQQGWGSLRLQA